jgi:hypothetical protein
MQHATPIILSQKLDRCRNVLGFVTERPAAAYPPFVNEEDSREGRAPIIDTQIDSFAVISCVISRATIIHEHKFSFLTRGEGYVEIGKRGQNIPGAQIV